MSTLMKTDMSPDVALQKLLKRPVYTLERFLTCSLLIKLSGTHEHSLNHLLQGACCRGLLFLASLQKQLLFIAAGSTQGNS